MLLIAAPTYKNQSRHSMPMWLLSRFQIGRLNSAQLNSLNWQLSWDEMSCKPVVSQSCDVKGLTTQLNSTQLNWSTTELVGFRSSWRILNMFRISCVEMRWVESCDVNATKNSTQLTSTSCDPVLLPGPIAAHRAVPARWPLGGIIMLVTSSCYSDLVYCDNVDRRIVKSFSGFFNRFSFPLSR